MGQMLQWKRAVVGQTAYHYWQHSAQVILTGASFGILNRLLSNFIKTCPLKLIILSHPFYYEINQI